MAHDTLPSTEATQPDTSGPVLLLSGLDSLYVCYYLDIAASTLDIDDLAYRKEVLRRSSDPDLSSEIPLGDRNLTLKPYGRFPYTYILTNEWFEIRLSERLKPSCQVRFSSRVLWELGLDIATQSFQSWCRSVGLQPDQPEIVTRADWAFDYWYPDFVIEPDWFVSKAKKSGIWREFEKPQTISFGKSDTVVRIYDKYAEIREQSHKYWFFEKWGQTEDVWRIEFQARKERLRRHGIKSIEHLKKYQRALLVRLATQHTSLRRPTTDTNRSRWPYHDLWSGLLTQIRSLPGSNSPEILSDADALSWKEYQQVRVLDGMIKGLGATLAMRGQLPRSFGFDDVFVKLPPRLRQLHRKKNWRDDVDKKIQKLKEEGWRREKYVR